MNGAGLPGTPSSSRTLPSSVTLRTKCPPSSVRNIVSSGVMWTPCARGYCPSPHERKKLPSRSKTIIGCTPIKHIDVVVVVDADPANLLERPPVGQLGPVVIDPI